jgi:fatty-acyl-CoA synthase
MSRWKRPAIRTLADIEAIESTPLEARFPERTTYDVIRRAAERDPDGVAVRFLRQGTAAEDPVTVSYAELFARVNQTANMLGDMGLKPGEAVSYLLPNLPQTHYVIWGGEAAGIVNAINPLLNPAQIADIMMAADSRILITLGPDADPAIWEKAQAVRKLVPRIETVIQVGGDGDERQGIYGFDALLDKYPGDRLSSGRRIAPDDIAAYFHTGGTTGSPKLARHTHWGEVYEAWVISYLADLGTEDCLLLGLPLFHVNAVVVTGLAPFMAGSSTVILSAAGYRNPSVIADFWKIVERYRATFFSAVPTIYSALLDVPIEGADVSSLRYAICGAAPMPIEVFREFEKRTGIRILEGYGLTEGTTASCLNPPDGERRVGAVGIRFPYQPMKAVRVDGDGRYRADCAPGEQGVIAINGPNVFPGYRQERFNSNIWVQDGWLNTGDLGRQDEDGYFWLTGRAKDLIIRGGHNIDPAMIEEVLHEHPAVALAAAVGKPDAYAGEIPVAYVVLKPGAEASADELKDYARDAVTARVDAALAGFSVRHEITWL